MVYNSTMTIAYMPEKPDIQRSKAILAALPKAQTIQVEIAGQQYTLPQSLHQQFEQLLQFTANGQASVITAHNNEMSSQEVADYLRVSRQFLVNEADAGRIAFRKIGTHRRFALADVLTYQTLTRQESLEAQQALADQAQTLGWDD